MSILELKNVTKSFVDGINVLDNVSLAVEKGDFLSIEGASGSGKSTLLTIMGGIDMPTEGQVLLNGVDITEMKERELAILRRREIGFVFQFFNLAPYLTVKENILLPIILDGKKTSDYEENVKEIMEKLGVLQYAKRLPSTISGGEQQRVAIARGMIFSPSILLLDEPTGNLDSKNSVAIMELLKEINEQTGTTIVQVTHSVENALYGNRRVLIKDGIVKNVKI